MQSNRVYKRVIDEEDDKSLRERVGQLKMRAALHVL